MQRLPATLPFFSLSRRPTPRGMRASNSKRSGGWRHALTEAQFAAEEVNTRRAPPTVATPRTRR